MLATAAIAKLQSLHSRGLNRTGTYLFNSKQLREYAAERLKNSRSERGPWYKRVGRFTKLDPSARVRISWDITMLVLLMYLVVMTPYRLGFDDDPEYGSAVWYVEKVMEYYFIVDLVINFRTGFFDKDGILEMRTGKIAVNYLRGFFWIDLISSIPFEDILGGGGDLQSAKVLKAGKVARVSRLLKIAKLARLLKLQVYLERFEDEVNISANKVKLLSILGFTFLIAHWNACGWSYVARISDQYFNASWQLQYGVLESGTAEYIAALYWSITTMTTVGYGDIVPQSDEERMYAIISMVFSGGFYGFVIATLSSLVTHTDANKRMTTEKMEAIVLYMRLRSFPKHLFKKVKRFYKHYYERKTALNEGTILHELSPHLRHEVALFLIDKTVSRLKLFHKLNPHSYSKLITILNPVRVDPGEWLVKTNEPGAEMYILISGLLEVYANDKERLSVLKPGSYFGELCALGISMHRTCGVKAKTACELYTLSREDLMQAFVHDEPQAIVDMIETTLELYDDVTTGKTKLTMIGMDGNMDGNNSFSLSKGEAADPEFRKKVIERAMNSVSVPSSSTAELTKKKSRRSISRPSSPKSMDIVQNALDTAIRAQSGRISVEEETNETAPSSSMENGVLLSRSTDRKPRRLPSLQLDNNPDGATETPMRSVSRVRILESETSQSDMLEIQGKVNDLNRKLDMSMKQILGAISRIESGQTAKSQGYSPSTEGNATEYMGMNPRSPFDISEIAKRVKERKAATQKLELDKALQNAARTKQRTSNSSIRRSVSNHRTIINRFRDVAFSVKNGLSSSNPSGAVVPEK